FSIRDRASMFMRVGGRSDAIHLKCLVPVPASQKEQGLEPPGTWLSDTDEHASWADSPTYKDPATRRIFREGSSLLWIPSVSHWPGISTMLKPRFGPGWTLVRSAPA